MTFLLEHPVLFTVLFVVYCICVSAFCWWWASGEEGAQAKKRLYDKTYFGGTLPVFFGFALYLWIGGLVTLSVAPAMPQRQPPTTAPALLPTSTQCQPDWVCKGLNINTK